MWKLLSACFVVALAEPDASCMLQAKHNTTFELTVEMARSSVSNKPFCKQGTAELDFENFNLGDKFPPNKINGVTITAKGPAGCTGPLQIIDPNKFNFNAPKMLLWSKAGIPQQCDKGPTVVTFTFQKLQDVEYVDLWDLVQGATGEVLDKKGKALAPKKASPTGVQMNNKRYRMRFEVRKVKKLVITLNGGVQPNPPEQGAIQKIVMCLPQAKIFGDPHIYTLDGERYDLYENGTFTMFHYTGQKPWVSSKEAVSHAGEVDWELFAHYGGPLWTVQGLLLVDRSMGKHRQTIELTADNCQWRSKAAGESDFTPVRKSGSLWLLEDEAFVTGFQYFSNKKIGLRMSTEKGHEDKLILNTVCNAFGINMRISMANPDEWKFVKGQIEVGNGEGQKKYAQSHGWASLGGSATAESFIGTLPDQPSKFNLLSACDDEAKSNAERTCKKHLGEEAEAEILEDCVFDVCRGGEDFAAAAAELLSI